MKILRKVIALAVYAALLFPVSEYRLASWMRAVELTSTSLDRTLRRRKSQIENERFIKHLKLLQMEEDQEEQTFRLRT